MQAHVWLVLYTHSCKFSVNACTSILYQALWAAETFVVDNSMTLMERKKKLFFLHINLF